MYAYPELRVHACQTPRQTSQIDIGLKQYGQQVQTAGAVFLAGRQQHARAGATAEGRRGGPPGRHRLSASKQLAPQAPADAP